jgi:hypothetical protein
VAEIQARFLAEELPRGKNPASLPNHVNSHCVANRPRSRRKTDPTKVDGGPYRLLYETRSGFRRLYRPGDDFHPDRVQPRKPSKEIPKRAEIPEQFLPSPILKMTHCCVSAGQDATFGQTSTRTSMSKDCGGIPSEQDVFRHQCVHLSFRRLRAL